MRNYQCGTSSDKMQIFFPPDHSFEYTGVIQCLLFVYLQKSNQLDMLENRLDVAISSWDGNNFTFKFMIF